MTFGIPRRQSTVLALAIAALALVAGGLAAWAWLRPPAERLEVYGRVPEFSLLERSGRAVTRSDLVGRVAVVDFFYTRCPDTCPLQSAYLARLQAELSGVPDARLVSITVDPDHDTPAVLAEYAARFGADPARWLFLTGRRDAIYRLAVDGFHLGAIMSSRSAWPAPWTWLRPASAWAHDEEGADRKVIQLVHSSRFALVDRQARIRRYVEGTNPAELKRLAADVKRLLAERR